MAEVHLWYLGLRGTTENTVEAVRDNGNLHLAFEFLIKYTLI